MGRKSKAEDHLRDLLRSVKVAERAGNVEKRLELEIEVAELLFERLCYDDALLHLDAVCSLVKSCSPQTTALALKLMTSLRLMTDCYIERAEFQDALHCAQQYLQVAESSAELSGSDREREMQQALSQCGRALRSSAAAADTPADAALRAQLNSEAERFFLRSERILGGIQPSDAYPASEIQRTRASLYQNMAQLWINTRDLHKAHEIISKGIAITSRYSDMYDILKLLYADARVVLESSKQYAKCVELMKSRLEAAETHRDALERFESLVAIGDNYCYQNLVDNSYRFYKRALHLRNLEQNAKSDAMKKAKKVKRILTLRQSLERTTDNVERAQCLEKIADNLTFLSATKKAVDFYLEAFKAYRSSSCKRGKLIAVLYSIVLTYKDLENHQAALLYTDEYIKMLNEAKKRDVKKLSQAFRLKTRLGMKLGFSSSWALEMMTNAKKYAESLGSASVLSQCNAMLNAIGEKSVSEIDVDEFDSEEESEEDETLRDSEAELTVSSCHSDEEENNKASTCLSRTRKNEKGETALQVACIKGSIKKVARLIKEGHPVNVKDNAGWTPLHEAANRDDEEMCELLLNAGARVDADAVHRNAAISPLLDALNSHSFKGARVLLKYGANPYKCGEGGLNAQEFLEKYRAEHLNEFSEEDTELFDEMFDLIREHRAPSSREQEMNRARANPEVIGELLLPKEDRLPACPEVVPFTPLEDDYEVAPNIQSQEDPDNPCGPVHQYEEALTRVSRGRLYHQEKKSRTSTDANRNGIPQSASDESDDAIDPEVDLSNISICESFVPKPRFKLNELSDCTVSSTTGDPSDDSSSGVFSTKSFPGFHGKKRRRPGSSICSEPFPRSLTQSKIKLPKTTKRIRDEIQLSDSDEENLHVRRKKWNRDDRPRSFSSVQNTLTQLSVKIAESKRDSSFSSVNLAGTSEDGRLAKSSKMSQSSQRVSRPSAPLAVRHSAESEDSSDKPKRSFKFKQLPVQVEQPETIQELSRDSAEGAIESCGAMESLGLDSGTSSDPDCLPSPEIKSVSVASAPSANTSLEVSAPSLDVSSFAPPFHSTQVRKSEVSPADVETKNEVVVCVQVAGVNKQFHQSAERSATIDWLSQRISDQFARMYDVWPFLKISKQLESMRETEKVGDVLDADDDILTAVISGWRHEPIVDAFKSCCSKLNLTPSEMVLEYLSQPNDDSHIDFSFFPDMQYSSAILTSLQYQHVTSLHLQSCRLTDDHCTLIGRLLTTCNQMTSLDLSNNRITSPGLTSLANAVSDHLNKFDGFGISVLTKLTLSSNPIQCNIISSLAVISRLCANLRQLHLASCGLGDDIMFVKNVTCSVQQFFNQITHLNLRFNSLSPIVKAKLEQRFCNCQVFA